MNWTRIAGRRRFLLGSGLAALAMLVAGGRPARAQARDEAPAPSAPIREAGEPQPLGRSTVDVGPGESAATSPLLAPAASPTYFHPTAWSQWSDRARDFAAAADRARVDEAVARSDAPTAPASSKVHGTITVDFDKVTITELMKLVAAVEKVDGQVHIVSSRDPQGSPAFIVGGDRDALTIARPGAPRAVVASTSPAQHAHAYASPGSGPPAVPIVTRGPVLEFPRLASLGKMLGLNRAEARVEPRPFPPRPIRLNESVPPAPRTDDVVQVSHEVPLAPVVDPRPLAVGKHLDGLSRGETAFPAHPPVRVDGSPPPPPIEVQASRTPKADPAVAKAGATVAKAAAPNPPRRHVAADGETFDSLARSFYGDARYGRALWWANRGRIAWPGALAAGKPLVVPAPGELEPRMIVGREAGTVGPEAVADRPRRDPDVQRASTEGGEAEGEGMAVHVVRPDDTIRIIAREVCGDERKALDILALNRDVLTAEGRPRVGQRLILPARAR